MATGRVAGKPAIEVRTSPIDLQGVPRSKLTVGAASRVDQTGLGAGHAPATLMEAPSSLPGLPALQQWPDAVCVGPNGAPEAIRIKERLAKGVRAWNELGAEIFVSNERLLPLSPTRELVARGFSIEGTPLGEELPKGLVIGRTKLEGQAYDVIYDGVERRFLTLPSGLYRPVEHGLTAARADEAHQPRWAKLLRKIGEPGREQLDRLFGACQTPEEHLLLSRVFLATGSVSRVRDFQRQLADAAGLFREDGRYLLKLATVDGLVDVLGPACVPTALAYQHLQVDPSEGLRILQLGLTGVEQEQRQRLQELKAPEAAGVQAERAVAELNEVLAPKLGDNFKLVARGKSQQLPQLLDLLAAHLSGKPTPAPEGVQVFLRAGGDAGHSVILTALRVERDLEGRSHRTFEVRDPSLVRSYELSEADLGAALLGFAARASVLTQHGFRPTRAQITTPLMASAASMEAGVIAIERLAAKGQWPTSNEVFGQRLEATGRVELLERFYVAQNLAWNVQYDRLPKLVEQGKWSEQAADEYKHAAYMLMRYDNSSSLRDQVKTVAEQKVTAREAAKTEAEAAREFDRQQRALEVMVNLDAKLTGLTETLFQQIQESANRALAQEPSLDFVQLARESLAKALPALQKQARPLLAAAEKKSPLNQEAIASRRVALEDFELWAGELAKVVRPDLTHGERFGHQELAAFEYSGVHEGERAERKRLIEGMVRFEPPADERDAHLLRGILDAFDLGLLEALHNAGYRIGVARGLLTTVEQELGGIDMADGVHVHIPGRRPTITVRSCFEDGVLKLHPGRVFHEVGHAIDETLRAFEGKPLRLKDELVEAFKAEHQNLPAYFHRQSEFVADSLRRYFMDYERARRELPLTTMALDNLGLRQWIPNRDRLLEIQRQLEVTAVVNLSAGDPVKDVAEFEKVNRARAKNQTQPAPYIIEVVGDGDRNGRALANQLAATMRRERWPGRIDFDDSEALLEITPGLFKDPQKLEDLLHRAHQSGTGAMLYFSDISQIDRSDDGFKILQRYLKRYGGVTPILFEGSGQDLDRLKKALPTVISRRSTLGALSPAQVGKVIEAKALDEGYTLSEEAKQGFLAKAKDGGLESAYELWQKVKTTQAQRLGEGGQNVAGDPAGSMMILGRDVQRTKLPPPVDPMMRLDRMVGQHKLKAELRMAIHRIRVAAADAKVGVGGDPPRQNLLIGGNQGTGKTTMADLFIETLAQKGVLANKRPPARLVVADLLEGGQPEANVKKLFETYKDSAIRIDEFHTLADTDEGKRALKAMIPYLEDPIYAGTVFVGCGYTPKLKALFNIDPGLERRFGEIKTAEDYNTQELGQILDNMLVDRDRTVSPEGREAALERLERERRRMRFFGNAGTVKTILEDAEKKRIARLAEGDQTELTAEQRRTLIPEDFAAASVISPAEVWKEIDAIKGNKALKQELRKIADSIEFAREIGQNPLETIEPYIFLDGGPGTGKSTVVGPLLARFFAAYDVVPTADFKVVAGPSLQGKYVGHTAGKVEGIFEEAWGGTLMLDEVSGIAKAGGTFKDEFVKTMLPILENNRGKFILLAADYAVGKKLFYQMDAGISRRFGMSVSLEALDANLAAEKIKEDLEKNKFRIGPEIDLEGMLAELASMPNYASGGDVRTLVGRIRQEHGSAFLQRRRGGEEGLDPFAVLPEAIQKAVDSLVAEKKAELPAEGDPKPVVDDHNYATETLTATKAASAPPKKKALLGREHAEVLEALSDVDRRFAGQYRDDPQAQLAAEKDPNSAYLKAVAEKLGVSPKEAQRAVAAAKEAAVQLVTVERLVKRFEYVCPYCGGVDSPTCAYIDMPLDWKIQHSLKKPWDEVQKTALPARE